MAGHTASPEARNKAVNKYVKTYYDLLQVKIRKDSGLRKSINEHISKTGESMNKFIQRAIRETIENDNKKQKKEWN